MEQVVKEAGGRQSTPSRTRPLRRRAAWGWLAVALLAPALAVVQYGLGTSRIDLVSLALVRTDDGALTQLPEASAGDWARVLGLVVGVTAGLLAALRLARVVFWTPQAKASARNGAGLTLAAAAAALVATAAAWALSVTDHAWEDELRTVQSGVVVVAVLAGAVAAVVAVTAVLVTVGRLHAHRRRKLRSRAQTPVSVVAPPPLEPGPPPFADPTGAAPEVADRRTRWSNAYVVPGIAQDELASRGPGDHETGFCVSGGGIRSATVTLGALQVLRDRLLPARWLVSVSGGGYTVGALQLALQAGPPKPAVPGQEQTARPRWNQPVEGCSACWREGDVSVAEPGDVLHPGSLEEDHLRRHSHYLADDAREWLVALAVVLRGLLASLLLLGLTVVTAGVVASLAYGLVPLQDLSALRPDLTGDGGALPRFPVPDPAVVAALGLLGLPAAISYVLSLTTRGPSATTRLRRAASRLTALALLVALAGAGLPAVVWWSASALQWSGLDVQQVSLGGSLGTVVLTYVVTLLATAWRHRKAVTKQAKSLLRREPAATTAHTAVPRSLVQRLVVLAALAAVAAVHLLLFGWVASTASGWPVVSLVLPPAVLLLVGFTVDQTRLGLHPFYRLRLASAFAVRRVRRAVDGRLLARPYCYDHESTELAQYGKRPVEGDGSRAAGFPEVVFAAAANLSGSSRTPPGRRAVGFSLSGAYVGGPDVGWVRTGELHSVAPAELQQDLTVQAAMALSGAAFASAMGRHARPFQTFLALSNARLGAWLPNPAFVEQWAAAGRGDDWTMPGFPRIRRLTYLLREVAGSFQCNDRLLYVTDGGHYENLGLVELLRRRSTDIYCIDASGDSPPVANTLAQAISLAYDELGVRVVLDAEEQWALVPGSAAPLEPKDPLASLNGRLAKTGVITGWVHYPEESGLPPGAREGRITVLKATLTPDLPYELLAHAVAEPVFPNDSTADQWFGHAQFTAYQALGRALGEQVLRQVPRRVPADLGRGAGARAQRPAAAVTPANGQATETTELVRSLLPLARDGQLHERSTGMFFVRRSVRRD